MNIKESHPVLIPLLNPNEPEALLSGVFVTEGQHVSLGDLLCLLETTKSTAELAAEQEGYIAGLRFEQGQTVSAGETLCYLAATPDWKPPDAALLTEPTSQEMPAGLRITKPALELAQKHSLSLENLPRDRLVTESLVRSFVQTFQVKTTLVPAQTAYDPTQIIVYGCGGHGRAVVELLRALGAYQVLGFIDDGIPAGTQVMDLEVMGGNEVLHQLASQGVRLAANAVGGIGNINTRIQVFQHLADAGFTCPVIVHPRAVIEPSARLSAGCQVFPLAYVGSDVRIGFGAIVNTGAIVSHDCRVGNYANISPGAILAGEVHVGDGVLVGMGATINLRVRVGKGARLGNGATVKNDVPENGLVRAGSIWPG